ncbi:MAG: hypothetical protein RSE55_06420 [Lachnospiraceae bacterium]
MSVTKEQFHTFHLDKSTLKVPVRLDVLLNQYFWDCPDFEEHLLYTKSGFLWVSTVQDACPYHEGVSAENPVYKDCGSCRFYRSEKPGEIIGICMCEALRRKTKSNSMEELNYEME